MTVAISNVAEDLLCIHAIITRGLNVSIEKGRSFHQDGYPDATTREGFISYVGSLVSVLHAHHLTESDLFFPYFKEKLPEAPIDLLTSQHRDLEPILQQAKTAMDQTSSEAEAGAALDRLNSLLGQVADFWHPHIRIEEDHFTVDRLRTLLDAKEHDALALASMQHSQQHAGPDYLVVPFLLHNLPPDTRSTFARFMPPVVIQELVPIVWKEKWLPMWPFLLA
jgi:hemerythrin-like domain-containing protein